MQKASLIIDRLSSKVGKLASYLILAMVLTTFSIVILRYCFGIGKVWLQELVIYFHATFFILGSSYTLLKDKHVRVDVLYTNLSNKKKRLINSFGSLFLTIPICIFLLIKSLPYVSESFKVLESSPDAGGLPGRFLLKALVPIFCILMILQAVSIVLKNLCETKNDK